MQPFVAADAGAFGPLIQSMPDPLGQIEKQMAFKVGLQSEQVNNQFKQAQISAHAQKIQRQAQFAAAMQGYLTHPTAEGLAQIIGQFPEFSEDAKAAYGAMDESKRTADLTQLGEITSLATGGNVPKAAELLKARIDADKAAGHEDPHDQMIYDLLSSGDSAKQQQAIGLLTYGIGVAVGPEHAGSFLKSQGLDREPDVTVIDGVAVDKKTGKPLYQSPFGRVYQGPEGFYVQNPAPGIPVLGGTAATGAPGGSQVGSAPSPAAGGFDAAVEHVLNNEGGYNASDMNGKPVNFGINQGANPDLDVKNMTREQAKQVYYDRYWKPSGAENLPGNLQAPYFDVYIRNPKVAKAALAKSKGDPVAFVDITDRYFEKLAKTPKGQKYAHAWGDRDAKNRAIATGSYYGGGQATHTATVGGKTYYQINGQWYDNPEGK